MFRPMLLAWFAVWSCLSLGCAGTWDTLTSRRFREHPIQTTQKMFSPEDPIAVLLSDPPRDGDERARAMHRLKEPLQNRTTPEEQTAVLAILERAAVSDPSPVVRMEAIGALGRIDDPRSAEILMAAYQSAHGRKDTEPAPPKSNNLGIIQTGAVGERQPVRTTELPSLRAPTGFPPEWVSAIRCRTADSLGRTNTPEAARFLATLAGGAGKDVAMEGSEDRDIRLAAVRGLGKCRQPEAVVALGQVLQVEADKKDPAMIGRTHQGLVHLTGKRLPPDPQAWNDAIQAGVVIAPEPSWLDTAIETAMFWEK